MSSRPEFALTIDNDRGIVLTTQSPFSFSTPWGEFTVEEGYQSDGYCAPRCLWGLLSPAIDSRTLVPACVHDWLYDHHVMSRAQADWYFRYSLIENGFPRWKAWISYLGVRAFGWSHWSLCEKS